MNKVKNIFVRAVSGIIFSVVYIFIESMEAYLGLRITGNYGVSYSSIAWILCACIEGIITPIWYFYP